MGPHKPNLGPKVKYFSNTMGTGLSGLKHRGQRWMQHDKSELLNNAYRKIRKRFSPEQMPFAQAVHIEVTNACNLQCIMCPQPKQERKTGLMDLALFTKIIPQLEKYRRTLEGVALMGLGEPLLHKQLERFSCIAKQARLPNVYTSTNATLLDAERTESILRDGCFDRIIFSLDGFTKTTFEKIRKGADFENVYSNVERFLKRKNEIPGAPIASIQILMMDQTESELVDFCNYWVPLLGPKDEIIVKEADTFGGLVSDKRPDPQNEPPKRLACRQLWKDLSIAWNGDVTVCCKDVFYKLSIGNANQDKLNQLWKSDKWNSLRKAHKKGVFSMDPCRDCREWYI